MGPHHSRPKPGDRHKYTFQQPENIKENPINYSNACYQPVIPRDVLEIIMSYSANNNTLKGVILTEASGSLDSLKLMVLKKLAATCKQYHKWFLGWFDRPEILKALEGAWYQESKWNYLDGYIQRNIFVFEFHGKVATVRPLLLTFVFKGDLLSLDKNKLDEMCQCLKSDQKSFSYTYSNIYRSKGRAEKDYELTLPVNYSFSIKRYRLCECKLRFYPLIEVDMTLNILHHDNGWTFENWTPIVDQSVEDFLTRKWNFDKFSLREMRVNFHRGQYW